MPRFAVLPCLLVLLFAPPLHAQGIDAEGAERMLQHGIEMQQSGDCIGAIDAYKTVLTFDPKRVDALSNLGACYVRIGEYDLGIAQYQAALEVDPHNVLVHLNLGLAYYKSGRPVPAIPPLEKVVAAPDPPKNAFLLLASCYVHTARYADAVALLRPREALFEKDLAYAYVLGMALVESGQEQEGLPYIDRIFGAGDSAEAHLMLGLAHYNNMNFKPAREEFEKGMRLNPRLPMLNSAYGRSLLALGERTAAEHALLREIAINPNDFDANLTLGSLRRSTADYENAIIYLTRALEIRPRDLNARKTMADVKLQTGAVEEAKDLLEGVVSDHPEFVEAHVQLATAYNRLKRREDAARQRQIVERLNAAKQEQESKDHPPMAAPAESAPKPPTPTPGTPEGSPR